MRLKIISGSLKGNLINAPSGHKTHPMSEKMRGAIFNMLGDIEGLTLLDAYAGSGAIAIEAYSRGARNIIAIDNDKNAFQCIKDNVGNLSISVKVTRANVSSWIDNNPESLFDIIVADPPYDSINQDHINKLATLMAPDGILVLSVPPNHQLSIPVGFKVVAHKEYGDSSLVFLKRIR